MVDEKIFCLEFSWIKGLLETWKIDGVIIYLLGVIKLASFFSSRTTTSLTIWLRLPIMTDPDVTIVSDLRCLHLPRSLENHDPTLHLFLLRMVTWSILSASLRLNDFKLWSLMTLKRKSRWSCGPTMKWTFVAKTLSYYSIPCELRPTMIPKTNLWKLITVIPWPPYFDNGKCLVELRLRGWE